MTCDNCGYEYSSGCECYNRDQDERIDRLDLMMQDIIKRLELMESRVVEND